MFEQRMAKLEAAVDGLTVPAGGQALARLVALRHRLDAVLALAVGAFERDGLWEIDGATSMVGWLRDRAGVDRRDTAR
ncbi:MAG: hypothetical protein AB7V15_06955, partial [Acidimicrobiia bacterium]